MRPLPLMLFECPPFHTRGEFLIARERFPSGEEPSTSDFWRTKDSLYLIFGSLLVMVSLFTIFAAVGYTVAYPPGSPQNIPYILPVIGGLCFGVGIVPGGLLIWLGLKARRLKGELIDFASWVKTYRRISITELARKLEKSEVDAERVLTLAVDKGLVYGFIDRQTNEFVAYGAGGQVMVQQCPACGASVNRLYMAGETILCPYCRSVIPWTAVRPA